MAMIPTYEHIRAMVSPIALRFGVKRAWLFGSYARGEAGEKSDVDVRIEKGEIKSLLQLIAFRQELESALHVPVDVITGDIADAGFLSAIRKDEVLLYER